MADPRVQFLRRNQTEAELLLWHQLRDKRVGGLRFRRQYRLGPYIVDFACLSARLVIEVDGPTHELTFDADTRRTRWLEDQGFHVMRFTNDQVMHELAGVVQTIGAVLTGKSET
ncbi:endonuclease domain-containing protein [Inquilinus sp. OTU3971]|uniref:endonuclease domain-containing protein n=1 Tax=Inquilinus sp. OTU3971 TaxID=3043855 RepID=UPI00313DB9F8